MPIVASSYCAPPWLPGGHLQTIVPARFMRLPIVQYRRERWDTHDGDFVDVDFALPEPASSNAPMLVMFHGLEGDSQSHYARSTMRWFADRGWRGLVVHFRGCSGEPNRLPRAYHSGDSDEGDWILRAVCKRWPNARLYAVGISLGGNMLAKWAGERERDAGFVAAAASIGSPLDLAAGGAALGRGVNMIYTRMFLATLKTKALAKLQKFPDIARDGDYTQRLRASRNLYQFDNEYTAPLHGFRNTEDYWDRASGKPWLPAVRIPYLVLNARNDPFVPAPSLPQPGDVSAAVELEQPAEGGHIGFARGPWPGRIDFIAERLHRFFTQRESSLA
ncbi:MAG TPA: alpha/beta fold hydrolase [Burkholderiaceae bacterium]|nr:alpha/beta fold hydrolase [Burkholderiaceae bacterium]